MYTDHSCHDKYRSTHIQLTQFYLDTLGESWLKGAWSDWIEGMAAYPAERFLAAGRLIHDAKFGEAPDIIPT